MQKQDKIQNTGKTPAKNKYGRFLQIKTVHCALFLQICVSVE